jgi:hypothetical protein
MTISHDEFTISDPHERAGFDDPRFDGDAEFHASPPSDEDDELDEEDLEDDDDDLDDDDLDDDDLEDDDLDDDDLEEDDIDEDEE